MTTMRKILHKVKTTYMHTYVFIVKQSAHFYFYFYIGRNYSSTYITEQKSTACKT